MFLRITEKMETDRGVISGKQLITGCCLISDRKSFICLFLSCEWDVSIQTVNGDTSCQTYFSAVNSSHFIVVFVVLTINTLKSRPHHHHQKTKQNKTKLFFIFFIFQFLSQQTSNRLIKIYGRDCSPWLRLVAGEKQMAAPKINSFQLSDICSQGIMTAHGTSHHVLFKLLHCSVSFILSSPRLWI